MAANPDETQTINRLLGLLNLKLTKDGLFDNTTGQKLLSDNGMSNRLIDKIGSLITAYGGDKGVNDRINSLEKDNQGILDKLKRVDTDLNSAIGSIKLHFIGNEHVQNTMNTISSEVNELQIRIIMIKCKMTGETLFIELSKIFGDKLAAMNSLMDAQQNAPQNAPQNSQFGGYANMYKQKYLKYKQKYLESKYN